MISAPYSGEFQWRLWTDTNRLAGAWGVSVTPAQNSKGSYAQLLSGANNPQDSWGIYVNINSVAVSTQARNAIIDIGIDPAGGTSYTVLIPDLLGSQAGSYVYSGGAPYYFPVRIPAGASIGARASISHATVGTLRVVACLFGMPKHPEAVRVGSFVKAIGVDSANSAGTAITAGTTSEGTFTSLGTTADDLWWWQIGMGQNDSSMNIVAYHLDLGAGTSTSNARLIIENQLVISTSTAEILSGIGAPGAQSEQSVKSGETMYGRIQCSGTADAGLSMIAYGVGG